MIDMNNYALLQPTGACCHHHGGLRPTVVREGKNQAVNNTTSSTLLLERTILATFEFWEKRGGVMLYCTDMPLCSLLTRPKDLSKVPNTCLVVFLMWEEMRSQTLAWFQAS